MILERKVHTSHEKARLLFSLPWCVVEACALSLPSLVSSLWDPGQGRVIKVTGAERGGKKEGRRGQISSIGQYLSSTYAPVIGYCLSTSLHTSMLYFEAEAETTNYISILSAASFYVLPTGGSRESLERWTRKKGWTPVCVTSAKALHLGSYNLFQFPICLCFLHTL